MKLPSCHQLFDVTTGKFAPVTLNSSSRIVCVGKRANACIQYEPCEIFFLMGMHTNSITIGETFVALNPLSV